jgi:hypothetical protein
MKIADPDRLIIKASILIHDIYTYHYI